MELIKKPTHIDFMGKFKTAIMFSVVLILAGIVSVFIHGGLKYGIDFAGGTLVQLKFQAPPSIEAVRDGLKDIGLADSTIQEFGTPNDILIRVERSEGKMEEMGARIKETLEQAKGLSGITVERVEMVGPKVGKDLRMKALLSIVYAIIGIVIYIS